MWLFIAFVAVPLIEITLFVQIGGAIGLGWTLVTVIITAILGTYFVRSQGLATLARLQSSFSDMDDPTEPLVHGAMILFAGALLLTPGFFTDAVGFALMVPAFRTFMFQILRNRIKIHNISAGPGMQQPGYQPEHQHPGDVIDGEFEEVPVDETDGRPSGWTRH